MKSRIKTKLLVFLALATLLINVFTSFSTVFVQAKTTASGYKIDVSYQNGIAKLTGNTSEVSQGYRLTALIDESTGQSYDPNTFSMQVLQNGTYNFVLNYTLDGISTQTQSERVEVVVDKLASGNAKNVTNTGAMPLSALTTQASVTDVPVELYAYENYDSTTPTRLGSTKIVSGLFADNIDNINSAIKSSITDKRSYVIGTLYRASDHSEIPIYGIWSHSNSDGSIDYYYSATKDSGTGENSIISIAYKANKDDQFRLYCELDSPQMWKLDTSSLNSGNLAGMSYNISPDPSVTSGKVAAGSKVTLSFTWPVSVDDVAVSVNGATVSTTSNYDKRKRHYEGTFTMPNKDTSIQVQVTAKQSVRWVGVYDGSGTSFLPFEIGWTKVTVDSATLSSGHTTKAWSTVKKTAGLNDKGYAKIPIIRNFNGYEKYYGGKSAAQTYQYSSTGTRTQSTDTVSGYLSTSSSDNTEISYPVQDYSVGQDIVINYESKRGRGHSLNNNITWWNSGVGNSEFNYIFPKVGRIDIYPQQQKQGTAEYKKGFTTESFLYFQPQDTYQEQKKEHPEWFESQYESQTSQAEKAGYYPVATELSNGMVIICYPQQYNTQAPFDDNDYVRDQYSWDSSDTGDLYQDLVGVYYNVKIVIKNAYDDVRIVTGKGTSTANNWYYLSSYTNNGIEDVKGRGDTGTAYTGSPLNVGTLEGGTAFTTGSNGGNSNKEQNSPKFSVEGTNKLYTYFRVKPKEGYSIPVPTIDGMPLNGTPYHGSGVISLANSSQASNSEYQQNTFISGILGHTDIPFYSSDDGYFNYSLFIKDGNGANHEVSFKSELIKFNVTYDKINVSEQSGYNAESKRYFSIPLEIPKDENGNSFNGWKLTAVSSDGQTQIPLKNIGTDGKSTDVFKPNDLVDVVKIYDQMKQQLGVKAIGISQYTLKFTADMEKLDPPLSGTAYVNQRLQTNASEYADSVSESPSANGLKTSITALKGSSFQISGISSDYIYNGTSYSMNKTKTDTSKFFVSSFDPSKSSTLVDVYYDKDIRVIYSRGDGTGTTPEDKNIYTTNSGSSNPSQITVASGNGLTMTNKKFTGWKIQVNGETGSKTYEPNSNIDLSTLSGESDAKGLRQAIFDTGSVTLVAQYEDDVGAIQKIDGSKGGDTSVSMADTNYEDSSQGKWIYAGGGETGRNDKYFSISGTFKYDGTEESYDAAKTADKIYYAFYKQTPTATGEESDSNYVLWKSTKNTTQSNSGNIVKVDYSDNLDKNGCFTVTVLVKNVNTGGNDSVTYKTDNNANYRIYCWTASNAVSGTFNTDGSSKTTIPDGSAGETPNLPSYTTKTRVLEPLSISGSDSNKITAKKLLYNDDFFDMTYEVSTGNSKLTEEEAKQELNVVFSKKDPNGSNVLWYSNHKIGNFNGGISSDRDGKFKVDTVISIKNPDSDNRSNKFVVSITDIRATNPLEPKYHSEAEYNLYAWDNANSTSPTMSGGSSNTGGTIDDSNVDIPHKIYTTYIIDNNSSTDQSDENISKDYNGVITYPTTARLEKKDDGKVETKKLSVELHGVWTKPDNTPGQEISPADNTVEHDYSYQVYIKTSGTTIVSPTNTQIKLSQNITNGQSFVADVLKNGTTKLQNGDLGTLVFAANGSPVTTLDFKVIGTAPELSSKDEFSGTMQYDFIQQSVKKSGG